MDPGTDDRPPSTPDRSPSSRFLEHFAPLPYQSLDEAGEIQVVNDAWLESLGYERDAAVGSPFVSFLASESAKRFETAFPQFKEQGSVSGVEFEMVRADGSTIVVSFDGQCEYDDDGRFRRTHCQFREETKSRETERRLRQQRDRFRALTGAIPDVVILYNGSGRTEEILTGQDSLLVDERSELVGKPIEETVNDDAATAILDAIDRTLRTDGVTRTEYRLQIDGEEKWFEGRVAPLQGADTDKVVFIARDISTRKSQEAELRETKERFELAIEGANLGVWDWDMETDQVSRHVMLREMLGFSESEFGGHLRDWERLVHPEGKARHDAALEKHVRDGTEYYECDYRLRTNDGDWKWVRNVGKVVEWDADGSPARAVGMHIDIDERKRAMQELARKTDQLEALNRVVRHDIRNDMNIIYGWAQQLEDHVDQAGEKPLERVLEVSEHVIDLTDVAREFVETLGNEERVDLEGVPLDQYLQNEIQSHRENFSEADIRVSGSIPELRVRANEMLSSVFRNLLVNAIKHNTADTPKVTIDVTEEPDSVEVTVADNGPGIPDERKETVFGKGEKGLDSEGTGIGLHLVHSLVSGYGGEVWITDNEPKGSEFHVELAKAE